MGLCLLLFTGFESRALWV